MRADLFDGDVGGGLVILVPVAVDDSSGWKIEGDPVQIERRFGVALVAHPPQHVLDGSLVGPHVERLPGEHRQPLLRRHPDQSPGVRQLRL
ncbi:hypothetical protein AS029_06065 [Microbacterium enclense]|nr:hypothetical protein AS029_06065 [Microbacterium enclense]